MPKRTVIVNDKMQNGYRYVRTAAIGRNFDPEFKPELTPREMLRLGVFCGKYMTDCPKGISAELVRARQALAARPRPHAQLLRCRRQPAAVGLAQARDGSIPMIRAAGSSGIAATTWAAACRTRTGGRSSAGRPSAGISGRSSGTASRGSDLPAAAAPGPSALGLRQPQDLTLQHKGGSIRAGFAACAIIVSGEIVGEASGQLGS